MTQARFIPRNAFDFATLTATSEHVRGPVSNLQNERRSRVWISGSTAVQEIFATWGGQGWYMTGVGLDRHNLTAAATVQIEHLPAADGTGTPVYDSGAIPAYDALTLGELDFGVAPLGESELSGYLGQLFTMHWHTRVLALSTRITITDTSNSDGHLRAARLVGGDEISLRNAEYGLRMGWQESTEQQESDDAALFSDGRRPRRVVAGRFGRMPEATRSQMLDFLRYVGKRKAFVASWQAEVGGELERDFTLLQAKFTTLDPADWSVPDHHDLPFTISES